MPDALKKADEVLQQAVQGITDLINVPALINLDFADVQTVMKDKGLAHIGIGSAKGDDKAIEAVKLAVSSPLLETTITGATHVLINVSGDIALVDSSEAVNYVQDLTGDNANIIFGAKYDGNMTDEATITVIATGLENPSAAASRPQGRYQSSLGSVNSVTGSARPITSGTRPVTSSASGVRNTSMGMGANNQQPATTPFNYGGIKKPPKPESSVKQKDIQIPEFLKNSRR